PAPVPNPTGMGTSPAATAASVLAGAPETGPGNNGTAPVAAPILRGSLGAKTGVNLLGDLEKWAYPDNQKVLQATLTLKGITIKQLRELCIKLPPKLAAELQITLPAEGGKSP